MGWTAGHISSCIAIALCVSVACTSSDASELDAGPDASEDAALQHRELPALCTRPRNDAVRDVFCARVLAPIDRLSELLTALGLTPVEPPMSLLRGPGASFVVLGHSTALSGRLVSPINPRVIFMDEHTVAAFQRGVQHVELASRDRDDGAINFYLVTFEQACNESEDGCSPGDLYTPRIEEGWSTLRIHDDEELANTAADCRTCHQRNEPKARLLMRELRTPWTHFFLPTGLHDELPGVDGSELTDDYLLAKGEERYAGVTMAALDPAALLQLENMAGAPQPLLFDAPRIVAERFPYSADGTHTGQTQPSATWEAAYEAFKRGEQLALPYFDQRATDPIKQARLTAEYRRLLAGEISADELPDLSDIFPDDPLERARIGLQTEPGASPQAVLIQACASCHNDVLDQSLSRARFNVDLSRMDRAQLDAAIQRIQLDRNAPGAMPPPEARQIDPGSRDAVIAYLKATHETPDPELQQAARLGMAGGAGP
jgi:mono/diheme cytochrome c family protein